MKRIFLIAFLLISTSSIASVVQCENPLLSFYRRNSAFSGPFCKNIPRGIRKYIKDSSAGFELSTEKDELHFHDRIEFYDPISENLDLSVRYQLEEPSDRCVRIKISFDFHTSRDEMIDDYHTTYFGDGCFPKGDNKNGNILTRNNDYRAVNRTFRIKEKTRKKDDRVKRSCSMYFYSININCNLLD